jgi:hypothetical protein
MAELVRTFGGATTGAEYLQGRETQATFAADPHSFPGGGGGHSVSITYGFGKLYSVTPSSPRAAKVAEQIGELNRQLAEDPLTAAQRDRKLDELEKALDEYHKLQGEFVKREAQRLLDNLENTAERAEKGEPNDLDLTAAFAQAHADNTGEPDDIRRAERARATYDTFRIVDVDLERKGEYDKYEKKYREGGHLHEAERSLQDAERADAIANDPKQSAVARQAATRGRDDALDDAEKRLRAAAADVDKAQKAAAKSGSPAAKRAARRAARTLRRLWKKLNYLRKKGGKRPLPYPDPKRYVLAYFPPPPPSEGESPPAPSDDAAATPKGLLPTLPEPGPDEGQPEGGGSPDAGDAGGGASEETETPEGQEHPPEGEEEDGEPSEPSDPCEGCECKPPCPPPSICVCLPPPPPREDPGDVGGDPGGGPGGGGSQHGRYSRGVPTPAERALKEQPHRRTELVTPRGIALAPDPEVDEAAAEAIQRLLVGDRAGVRPVQPSETMPTEPRSAEQADEAIARRRRQLRRDIETLGVLKAATETELTGVNLTRDRIRRLYELLAIIRAKLAELEAELSALDSELPAQVVAVQVPMGRPRGPVREVRVGASEAANAWDALRQAGLVEGPLPDNLRPVPGQEVVIVTDERAVFEAFLEALAVRRRAQFGDAAVQRQLGETLEAPAEAGPDVIIVELQAWRRVLPPAAGPGEYILAGVELLEDAVQLVEEGFAWVGGAALRGLLELEAGARRLLGDEGYTAVDAAHDIAGVVRRRAAEAAEHKHGPFTDKQLVRMLDAFLQGFDEPEEALGRAQQAVPKSPQEFVQLVNRARAHLQALFAAAREGDPKARIEAALLLLPLRGLAKWARGLFRRRPKPKVGMVPDGQGSGPGGGVQPPGSAPTPEPAQPVEAPGRRSGGPRPKIKPKPFPEEYPNVQKAFDDPAARGSLRPEVRKAYADWYDSDVAPNVSGNNAELARRFNLYRAGYLRGKFNEPPGRITDTHWRKYVP